MFTVNNSNYHLINGLWAVSLPKRAMSHSKYWQIRGWMQIFTILYEGYNCCPNPHNQPISIHLQRSTSFLLPWFSPKIWSLRNHLVQPVDQISPGYSVTFFKSRQQFSTEPPHTIV